MSFLSKHKWEVGVFALALLLRCLYLGAAYYTYGGGDLIQTVQGADGYFVVAQNIVAGHGFSGSDAAPYAPYSFRPPLQHYFLAAGYFLFGSWWGAVFLLLLMGSVLPVIAMFVLRDIFSEKVVRTTGVIFALEPVAILYSTFFYSETLFMFFFFLSLLFLFKHMRQKYMPYLVYSACFLGFTTLTRPTSEYVPLIIAVLLLWEGRRYLSWRVSIGRALLFVGVFVLVLAPWLWRNEVTFGHIALSPQVGINLYANLVPSVMTVANGTTFQVEYDKLAQSGVKGPNATGVGDDKGYTGSAAHAILEHPLAFILLSANTLLAFFTHDGVFEVIKHVGLEPDLLIHQPALFLLIHHPVQFAGFLGYYITKPAVLILFARVAWVFATLLLFVGAWRYLRKESSIYATTLLSMVAYFALITIPLGLTINARYRLPVEAFIIPFAIYGLVYLKTLWRRFR